MRIITCIFIILLSYGNVLIAADSAASDGPDKELHVNQAFITKAAVFNLTEVAGAKLALQRDMSNDLNTYSRVTIRSHEQANEVLAKLARDKQLAMVTELPKDTKEKLAALEKVSQEKFLVTYLEFSLANHNQALQDLEAVSAYNKDEDMRKHANYEIIRIKQHIQSIKILEDKYK